jgi:hypothetical protein
MKLWMARFSWPKFLYTREKKDVMVESKVEVIEVDGAKTPMNSHLTIPVRTHLTEPSYVVLMVGAKTYCVKGRDLIKAVKNVIVNEP